MKLIINATEINSGLEVIRAIGHRLPMGREEMLKFIENTGDAKKVLKDIIENPRHGLSIQIKDGKTFETAELSEIAYVIEIPEEDIIAVHQLLIRHSGMIVSIVKMYHTVMELMGEFAMSFGRDLVDLGKTHFKTGKKIDVEKDVKVRRTRKATASK